MEDLSGKQLGPYQVVALLGEGGMAVVYKAYQPSMDRYVALKILPRYFARDPQFVGRFEQEAKVIAKFQHPHILPVFDYGEEDGYTYIVMPFVEGGTLADSLKGQPLSLAQTRRVITQVGDALDYAHSQGVVHRDVKPSNILIDPKGNCLLTDFGVAKIVEGTAQFTQAGEIFGTPAYMSPEQVEGEELDGRSDVYSLGIVLYEIATGRPPFRAETPPATFVKHLLDPPPPPRTLNPALPEAVEQVTLKALAKDREERYATAGDMVRALQAATEFAALSADSSEILKEPPTVLAQPHHPIRRWILAGCGAGIAVIGIVIVAGVIGLAALVGRLFGTPASAVETGSAASGTVTTAVAPLAEKQPTENSEVGATTAPQTEASATAGATPTTQVEPTPMAIARTTAVANGVLVFEDDFSSNANGWWEGKLSDEYGDYADQIIDGKFRLSVVSKQPAWNWSWVPDFSAKDFWLSVEVTIVEVSGNPGDAQVTIAFRENENDDYYEVEFANDGTYRVWLHKDDEWNRLQKWMPSDAFKLEPGVTNTIDLLVMGSSFTLYANGQDLNTVTDSALGEAGQISLTIGLEKADQTLTVEFDNLVIKEVPGDRTVAEIGSTATAKPLATTTARAESTLAAIARTTAVASAVLVFEDDFSSNTNGWQEGESSDEYGDYADQIIDGKFRLSLTSKGPAWNWSWVPDFSAKDFWLSVEVTIIEGSGDAEIGIAFRENKNGDHYYVEFENDGTYQVELYEDGEWNALQEWVPSDAIKLEPSVTNTFALLVTDSDFTFYANGQELNTVTDTTLREAGEITLVIAAIDLDQADQTLTVDFDNLVIKEVLD